MNPLLHSIRLYLSRFRWEIALLWLASASLSAAALAGSGEAVTSRLAPLELVFLGIVIIRFAMAEDVFGTTGGWRIRPLEGRTLFRARMLALLVAVLPPVLFRLGVWMWTANPTGWNFLELLWNDGLPVVVLIGGFLLLVRLARQWVAREAAGVALLVIGPALLLVVFLWLSHAAARKGGNFGVASRKDIPPALAEAMPAGSHFLGKIRQGNTERVDRIATLPLLPGTYEMGARKAMIKHVGMVDDRLELVMGFQSLRTVSSTRNLIFVVRYSDGSYATGGESSGTAGDVRFWLFKVRGETRRAIYESPLSLPWNRRSWAELLGGAELMIFDRREPFFDRQKDRPASLIRS